MFTYSVAVNLAGTKKNIFTRFDKGSNARYELSRIVFDGSRQYMPKVTGTFENLSYMHSEPLFAQGELLYPGPFAHYLWEGILYVDPEYGKGAFYSEDYGFWSRPGADKVPSDRKLVFNREANPMAGSRWVERAKNDKINTWVSELQGLINEGKV